MCLCVSVCRLERLKDVIKTSESLAVSLQSLREWLLETIERLMSPCTVVYETADSEEIRRHLTHQEVIETHRTQTSHAPTGDSCL